MNGLGSTDILLFEGFRLHRRAGILFRLDQTGGAEPVALVHRFLAASYAHLGRLDEAREVIARLRTFTSVVTPNAGFLRNPEHRELLLSGLRLAAGEAE